MTAQDGPLRSKLAEDESVTLIVTWIAELFCTTVPQAALRETHLIHVADEMAKGFRLGVLAGVLEALPHVEPGELVGAYGERLRAEVVSG